MELYAHVPEAADRDAASHRDAGFPLEPAGMRYDRVRRERTPANDPDLPGLQAAMRHQSRRPEVQGSTTAHLHPRHVNGYLRAVVSGVRSPSG